MAVETAGLVRVGRLEEIDGPRVVSGGRHGIAVFVHEGKVYAVDNRCPHMGFPLHRGSVCDGILTCHWHHARFDLASGGTFDPWADDVRTYDTVVEDGVVYVNPRPRPVDLERHWKRRLHDGLEHNLSLVMIKAVLGLREAGVPERDVVEIGGRFGATYRMTGWGPGLTILTAMANVLPLLERDDRALALYHGLVHVARDCAGEPPRFQQEALPASDAPTERLAAWFRQFVEVRDVDGAERALLTAIERGASPATLADMLFSAATDHVYLNGGHTVDFINKACEMLDLIGWEHAAHVLPSVVRGLATARRSEELNTWRHPVDLVGLLAPVIDRLPARVARAGTRAEVDLDGLSAALLGDDPAASVAALVAALERGAALTQLSQALCYAAALRVARFHTSNEFSDWITVVHTFTYCNALHQGLRRAPSAALARGLFHGAAQIYLDRFLNMPAARLPEERRADGLPDDAEALLASLRDLMDREQRVNESALVVHRYLSLGHDPAPLIATLGHLLLREDAEFHSYQMLEAGVALERELRPVRPEAANRVLVAVARYLAAHAPTPRAMLQTARTAIRLQRGEAIYEDAEEEEAAATAE
ncbi:MAG: Rieske 2Fe-2S domain-containing protein [Thermomicrobiaceae bacterium]|nr:Rieske 2Fe-2S domain-containing protein [Thermomicrobiaceae bacterium]